MSIEIKKVGTDYKIVFDDGSRPEYFDIKDELDERVRELKGKGYIVINDHRL